MLPSEKSVVPVILTWGIGMERHSDTKINTHTHTHTLIASNIALSASIIPTNIQTSTHATRTMEKTSDNQGE